MSEVYGVVLSRLFSDNRDGRSGHFPVQTVEIEFCEEVYEQVLVLTHLVSDTFCRIVRLGCQTLSQTLERLSLLNSSSRILIHGTL